MIELVQSTKNSLVTVTTSENSVHPIRIRVITFHTQILVI